MPSKNSLKALKAGDSKGKLVAAASGTQMGVKRPVRKVGRPAKAPAEKESFVLSLKLTEAEGQILKDKAGLVSLATYVKAYLRTKTDILK